MFNGEVVGGVIVNIEEDKGDLEILFVDPDVHSKGIGYAIWQEIEKMYPDVRVWETLTLYFETRNIHFYVNRSGFHIVEFFNEYHRGPEDDDNKDSEQSLDGMFRFEKRMW